MLKTQGIGVVILAKNGETLLHFDNGLQIGADAKWKVHEIQNGQASRDLLELRDLSC